MKKTIASVLLSASVLSAGPEDYRNFILQIQSDDTTHLLNNINSSGYRQSLAGVIESSVFQLWTVHKTTADEHLLDEKTVSAYHPQATMNITSADPYTAIPRTRVDHPFTVQYSVSGIVTNDPNVQDAAKSVVFQHDVVHYQAGTNQPDPTVDCDCHEHSVVSQNGSFSDTHMTSLHGSDMTKVRGEEMFSIYANPDFGVVGASLLAQKKVQVWPIASATITGIDGTVDYLEVPEFTVNLVDLYPASTTFVRYYKSAPSGSPVDVKYINTSFVTINDVKPQNRVFNVSALNNLIQEDGSYTIEVLHQTPFGYDLLAQHYPLKVKRGIKIRGNVNSSE